MCIGRDARINNSRVISRIIIRYIGVYVISTRIHPQGFASEEALAYGFTRSTLPLLNTVTGAIRGKITVAEEADDVDLMCSFSRNVNR